MKTALFTAILILSLGLAKAGNNVIDGKMYLMKVVDRMMENLKAETSISGDGLPMLDMVGSFSGITFYGINLDGLVHFVDGFVMKIGKIHFIEPKYLDLSDSKKALLQTTVIFENVDVTYELNCELEEYEAITSQVIHFDGLEFFVSVTKDHASGLVQPLIKFENIFGGIFKIAIQNIPSNPHTQIIAKEMKKVTSTTKLFDKLKASFVQWKNLQKFLEKASQEIKFPEICYTCP